MREFDCVPLRCRLRGRFGCCTHVGFGLGGHACRSISVSEFLCICVCLCLCLCLYSEVGLGLGLGALGFANVLDPGELDFGAWGA